MQQVRKFWTKVERVVQYKEQQVVNAVKKKVRCLHLPCAQSQQATGPCSHAAQAAAAASCLENSQKARSKSLAALEAWHGQAELLLLCKHSVPAPSLSVVLHLFRTASASASDSCLRAPYPQVMDQQLDAMLYHTGRYSTLLAKRLQGQDPAAAQPASQEDSPGAVQEMPLQPDAQVMVTADAAAKPPLCYLAGYLLAVRQCALYAVRAVGPELPAVLACHGRQRRSAGREASSSCLICSCCARLSQRQMREWRRLLGPASLPRAHVQL